MQQLSSYESLRSWYLAKLRKSAIEAQVSGQLTPSALIAADREVIEKLIAERSESDEAKDKEKQAAPGSLPFVLFLWLYLIIGALVSIFLYCLADLSVFPDVLMITINPVNLAATGSHSIPSQIVMLVVQLILFIYPIVMIPYAFFSKPK